MKVWKAIWRYLPGLARIRVLGSVSARASRQQEVATRRAQLIGRLTEPEVIRGAILVLLALAELTAAPYAEWVSDRGPLTRPQGL